MAYKDPKRQIEAANAYNKEKYDRIVVMLPKGYRDKLRQIVGVGGSITAYIKTAIDERMKKEGQQ